MAFVILVALAAWLGIRGYLAQAELRTAAPSTAALRQQLLSGETAAAAATGNRLAEHVGTAAELTSDPIWRLAEFVPWAGKNLTVMREISAAVNDVAQQAVIPLSGVAASVDPAALKPTDGHFDLTPLVEAQPDVSHAADALEHATARVTAIDTAGVIEPLAEAHAELESMIVDVNSTMQSLDRAVHLLPAMLGANEPRNNLLLFQNNAELRASGGIPGALALLHSDGGSISLARQASSSDFPRFDEPVVELPIETEALYGNITARFVQDVNLTPQFPLSASIAREMWQRNLGDPIDGVISVDPVALSYLLEATGPVTLPTGDQLTSDNAVSLLLSEVYSRYPQPREQDAFFASAAAAVFDTVASGAADPAKLIAALTRAGEERRILIWNTREDEQALLAGTTLAGELPVETADTQPIGVYFNDATGSKMDPYLDITFEAGTMVCREDGRPENAVRLTMANTAPADAAVSLPDYVTGSGAFGTPPGSIRTNVMVYGTPGSYNLGVLRDGQPAAYQPTADSGYTVSFVQVELAPGESTTLDFRFLADEAVEKSLYIEHSPLVYNPETLGLDLQCEDALS